MHGSMWRREETGTSRASTCRAEPGASRRPDRERGPPPDARSALLSASAPGGGPCREAQATTLAVIGLLVQ
jgi:hypothetical protein